MSDVTTTDHTSRPARILARCLMVLLFLAGAVMATQVERAVPVDGLHLTLAGLHLSGWLVAVVLFLALRGAFEFFIWPVCEYLGDHYQVEGFRVRRRPIAPMARVQHPEHGPAVVLKVDRSPEAGRPWALIGPDAEGMLAQFVPLDELERAS
jgi:membrane protein YdbS with pleckstrin-like domain